MITKLLLKRFPSTLSQSKATQLGTSGTQKTSRIITTLIIMIGVIGCSALSGDKATKKFPRLYTKWHYKTINYKYRTVNTKAQTMEYQEIRKYNGKDMYVEKRNSITNDTTEIITYNGIYYDNEKLVIVEFIVNNDSIQVHSEVPLLSINEKDTIIYGYYAERKDIRRSLDSIRILNNIVGIINDTIIKGIEYNELYEIHTLAQRNYKRLTNIEEHAINYLFSPQEGIVLLKIIDKEKQDSIAEKSELFKIEDTIQSGRATKIRGEQEMDSGGE